MFNEVEPQGAVRIAGQVVGHGGQALDDLSKAQTGGYLWDGPVAVALCSNPEAECPLSGMLLDLRGTQLVEVGIGTGDDIPYDWIEQWAQNLSYIILDADAWGGVPALVGFCMWLRRLAPSVPIIILSSDPDDQDFTTERIQICDVTVTKPFTARAMSHALATAEHNNSIYIQSFA